ncbi:PQQ-binding-like beta-propeller repeat protein, partial [Planctomycetota bacterium]
LDAKDGTVKWKFKTGDKVRRTPCLVGGTVYFNSMDGLLYAVDATSGEQKWTLGVVFDDHGAPVIVNDILYLAAYEKSVYALKLASREAIWLMEFNGRITAVTAVATAK